MKILTFIAALFLAGSANAQIITPGQQQFDGVTLPGGKVAGRFYYPFMTTAVPAGAALAAANRLYAMPMFVGAPSVLKSLSFNISAANASAWNVRMCVYSDNGSGSPGALVADTGTVAVGATITGTQTAALSGGGVSVGPGWVWLAFMADSTAESLLSWSGSIGVTGGPITNVLGANSLSAAFGGGASNALYMAQTFGACPATFSVTPTLNAGANAPFIVAGF